jgi:hypothetical protein
MCCHRIVTQELEDGLGRASPEKYKEGFVRILRATVLVALILASMSLAGAAFAQSAEQPPEDEVRGEVIRNEGPDEAPDTLPSLQPRAEQPDVAPGVLPFTGSDLTLFVVAGAVAVGAGTLIVRRARSRA